MLLDLKIPLQEAHAKEIINKVVKYLYTKIFTEVLLGKKKKKKKKWKQPKLPTIGKLLKKIYKIIKLTTKGLITWENMLQL